MAQANDVAGNTSAAYDSLTIAFVNAPSPRLKEQVVFYGKKMGKTDESVERDIQNPDAVVPFLKNRDGFIFEPIPIC